MASSFKKIFLRKGILSELDAANPVLASGEAAFAVDTQTLRVGDGEQSWSNLASFINTRELKKTNLTVSFPQLDPQEVVSISVPFAGIKAEDKYLILTAPENELPDYIEILYAYVSNNNTVTIKVKNTFTPVTMNTVDGGNAEEDYSDGYVNAFSAEIHLIAYLIFESTTTTTTTTTNPPVTNSVYTFGYNEFGQLGLGNDTERLSPTLMPGNKTWKSFTVGHYHSAGIDYDDDLFTFGYNYYGQLGLNNVGAGTSRLTPTKISGVYIDTCLHSNNPKWKKVSAGAYHTLAIDEDDKLYSFGSNAHGCLGLGIAQEYKENPVLVGSRVNYLPFSTVTQAQVESAIYTFPSITSSYSCGVKFILPTGEYIISGVPEDYPIAILNAGKTNLIQYSGQYLSASSVLTGTTADGLYNFVYGNVFVNVSGDFDKVSLHSLSDGYMGGENIFHFEDPSIGWSDVSAGSYHSLAIKNGELYAFGNNTFGQLGINNTNNQNEPVKVGSKNDWTKIAAGSYHSIALDSSGNAWSFGLNNYGQLGLGDKNNRLTPTKVTTDWRSLDCYEFTTLNTTSSIGIINTKYIFGYNVGKTYDEQERYLLSSGTYTVSGIPSGFAIAILNDGKSDLIQYSGSNLLGQKTVTGSTANGTYNFYYGTLTINVSGDFEKMSVYSYNNGYMGGENVLYYNKPDNVWVDVAAGVDFSILRNNKNELWSFGKNNYGQLGLSDNTDRLIPTKLSSSNWVAFDAGGNHAIAVNTAKDAWSFGQNNHGQLGLGDKLDRNEPTKINSPIRWGQPRVGGNHSLITVFSYFPNMPVNVIARNADTSLLAGSKDIALSWTLDQAEEQGILEYIINYSVDSGATWEELDARPTAKSYVITGLDNGTDYQFKVAARNYVGVGAYSTPTASVAPKEAEDQHFSDVIFLSHLDGELYGVNFEDLSNNDWQSQMIGSITTWTPNYKFGGASLLLDGSNGLFFGSGSEFNTSGNLTVECFIRPTQFNFNNQTILSGSYSEAPTNTNTTWQMYVNNGNLFVRYIRNTLNQGGGFTQEVQNILTANNAISLNQWQHVAWVRNGNVNSLYINGVKKLPDYNGPVLTYDNNGVDIGCVSSKNGIFRTGTQHFIGQIDEVRISKRARYSGSTFIPPVRSFGVL